jgi:hypothetical protein
MRRRIGGHSYKLGRTRKICCEHPELVQLEMEHFASREVVKKKKKKVEAAPSTIVVLLGSSSELDSDI